MCREINLQRILTIQIFQSVLAKSVFSIRESFSIESQCRNRELKLNVHPL